MSEELFSEEIKFPEDLETMLSMSVHYEKLQSIMKFILDLLKRHEQGLRMSFSKQNVIAPEILTLHAFKENLEQKIVSLEKSLQKTNKNLEDVKQNLESRGDTVSTLRYILNTLTEHDSVVLTHKKLLGELIHFKDTNEKRLSTMEETMKKLELDNQKLRTELADQDSSSKGFHRPEDEEKPLYRPPNRKYISKKKQLKSEQIEDDKTSSPSNKSLSPKRINEKSETFQLTNPNIPPHLQELFNRIKTIEKVIESPPDSKEIKARVGKLESMYKFIEGIVDSCEPLTIRNRDQIIQVVRNLRELENEMANKLNTEDFDAIKNLVITLASGSDKYDPASIIPTREINMIRTLERKVAEIERNFSDLVKIYPENIEEVALKLRRIEQKLHIKAGEDQFESLQKTVNDLSEKFKQLLVNSQKEAATSTPKPLESSILNSINRKVAGFEEAIRGLKIPSGLDLTQLWDELKKVWQLTQNLSASFEELKKIEKDKKSEILLKLESKVDLDSLKFIDDKLKKMIESLTDKFTSQYAEKNDMRRGLKYLENMVKNLESGKMKPEGDDAMLARKPLEGWSCASCEKKLESLTGRIPSHSPWRKLPLRDASERMLKAGPGYSKMLSTLQLDNLRTRSDLDDIHFLSNHNTDRSVTPQP